MKKLKTFTKQLQSMKACKEGVDWVQENNYTLEEAWKHCHRGDWMLFYAAEVGVPIRPFILAKGLCAQLVEHLMQDQGSIQAVHTAIGFGHGEVTREELDRADADAAYATTATYDDPAADAAADAAAYATYDAGAGPADASVAAAVAVAAYAAAYYADASAASSDNAAAAERKNVLQQCADICRDVLTPYVLKEQS